MENILSYKNVEIGFEHKKILNNINLDIYKGDLVLITGESGSGKSTLMKLAVRFIQPDSGYILFKGKNVNDINPQILRSKVGYIPQNPYLVSGTVLENFKIVYQAAGKQIPEDINEKCNELLNKVGLAALSLTENTRNLSGGETARISILRSWMMEPELLLLDEPVSGLDPKNADRVISLIASAAYKSGQTIMIVSHSIEPVIPFNPRIINLQKGIFKEADNG